MKLFRVSICTHTMPYTQVCLVVVLSHSKTVLLFFLVRLLLLQIVIKVHYSKFSIQHVLETCFYHYLQKEKQEQVVILLRILKDILVYTLHSKNASFGSGYFQIACCELINDVTGSHIQSNLSTCFHHIAAFFLMRSLHSSLPHPKIRVGRGVSYF